MLFILLVNAMYKVLGISLILICTLGCVKKEASQVMEKIDHVRLTIVYDNNPYDKELTTSWGFSCLVESEDRTILFDTGGDAATLINNISKLKIDIGKIDTIVLSHIHGDHVGGVSGILEKNPNLTIYLLSSFPESFKEGIKKYGCNTVEIHEETEINDYIMSTGELGTWIKEQSLLLSTDKGIVVITGCAHPGIVNIVKKAKEITGGDIYLVIGGFHLGGETRGEIGSIIEELKDLGVEKIAPCHCSGDLARSMFKEAFGNNYIEAGVGAVIEI